MLKNPSIMPDSILKQHRTFSSRYANPAKPDVTTPMSSGNLKYPAYTKIERKDAKELNDRDLGYWFAELRTEDASACAWIQKHAGAFHPCDWLRPIDKKSLSHWKKYPPERAINELHWCLSDGKRDLYSPLNSVLYPCKSWDAWVGAARKPSPSYWKIPKVKHR